MLTMTIKGHASPPWYLLLLVPLLLLFSESMGSHIPSARLQYGDIHDIGHPLTNTTHRLSRRDDYTCASNRPCNNQACCGIGGYCGYGPTYCGQGNCTSNCNAHAECGQYAVPAGKTCPLNTCCSKAGFCGTTSDYCTGGCQSNCNLNPSPPAGGTPNGALSKVIGYYESWASRLSCHKMQPSDLPLSAMTHLNYAFAYIDPNTFDIVTMDGDTPVDLFSQTTAVKKINPALKVFCSVGGWTFSDNGTATQPVFGNIASTAANRQKFANNVLKFLNNYGFDGLDIDWEYPGAPDRGGSPADTQNYVSLMQTLRTSFNVAPRPLGLTFTAPSSYWYLRWFDLPNMLKWADWINFMTYDLHGTWDRNNPIGSIVQGHTNLTEIQLATQLLWRVNVPPGKVALGYGFYGRSFQLSNPSCNTPGCQFSGGAAPGPCSATSGILMYYEIQALLKQHPDLKPVWDKTAAVKFLTFNNDQWVSYDDGDTFKQKVDWANSVGLNGALIWAADTDDSQYTAMSALTGKSLQHVDTHSLAYKGFGKGSLPGIVANLIGQNGQDCRQIAICQDGPKAGCGDRSLTKIGWNHDLDIQGGSVCKNPNDAVPICCPSETAPQNCIWRGSTSDCNGQCHAGETQVAWSKHGGGNQSEQKGFPGCTRGQKVFCCEAGDFKDVIQGCNWKCSCDSNTETSVLQAYGVDSKQFNCPGISSYCCPMNTPLNSCAWRGTLNDCADARCASGEVVVARDPNGDLPPFVNFHQGYSGCLWYRNRVGCCKVTAPPASQGGSSGSGVTTCPNNFCDFNQALCADDQDDTDVGDDDDDSGPDKRDTLALYHVNEKRARLNTYSWLRNAPGRLTTSITGRRVPDTSFINNRLRGQDVNNPQILPVNIRPGRNDPCDAPTIVQEPITARPDGTNLEHPIPVAPIAANRYWHRPPPSSSPILNSIARLPSSWAPNNVQPDSAPIAAGYPVYPSGSPDLLNLGQRVMEPAGSTTNFNMTFFIVDRSINFIKGKLEERARPVAANQVRMLAANAANNADNNVFQRMLADLHGVIRVFQYLNLPTVSSVMDQTAFNLGQTWGVAGRSTGIGNILSDGWNVQYPLIQTGVSEFARQYMVDYINEIREAIARVPSSDQFQNWLSILTSLENQIPTIKYPFEGTVTTPSSS